MNYNITPSPFSATEVLVTFTKDAKIADIKRGRQLAESLRGRWSIRFVGHFLTPKRAERWKLLFDAGWEAVVVYRYNVKSWVYTLGEKRNLTAQQAVNLTRRMSASKPISFA